MKKITANLCLMLLSAYACSLPAAAETRQTVMVNKARIAHSALLPAQVGGFYQTIADGVSVEPRTVTIKNQDLSYYSLSPATAYSADKKGEIYHLDF